MASKIDRQVARFTDLLLTNSLSTTAAIVIKDHAALTLYFPSDWTSATITVYGLNPVDDEYLALCDSDGTAITFTAAASKAITLADSIFPCDYIKCVTDQAGNNAKVVGGTAKS